MEESSVLYYSNFVKWIANVSFHFLLECMYDKIDCYALHCAMYDSKLLKDTHRLPLSIDHWEAGQLTSY